MAKKVITRTITTTTVNCLVADKESREFKETSIVLSGTFKDDIALKKSLNAAVAETNLAIMEIISTVVNEQLYACTEEDFLSIAKPITRTHKVENKETQE